MQYFASGAASLTNFLIAIADYAQVFIARTNILGNPDEKNTSGEIAKQRRVGAMAWTQIISGIGGLGAFLKDMLVSKEKEVEDDLSSLHKTGLSFTSLTAAMTMLATYSEKVLIASTSKGKQTGNEIKGIMLDARNDFRACIEYIVMSLYPWLRTIKPAKHIIDFLVPITALRDGIVNFVTDGVSKVFAKEPNAPLPDKLKNILKYLFLIPDSTNGSVDHISVPAPISSNWFLGENGVRNNLLVPIYKSLGCKNIPKISLQENKEGDRTLSIHVEYNEQAQEPTIVKGQNKQTTPPRTERLNIPPVSVKETAPV